jgi:ABC-2 type transport system permease protein
MWWTLGVGIFIAINLAFYPSFKDQSQELSKALQDIPDSAMALFSDTGDFFSPVGYLSSQVFYLMLPMLLSILAISLGASLLGKEEKEGTLELLLSKPLSRTRLLVAKAVSGILITLCVGLVATLIVAVLAIVVDIEVSTRGIVVTSLICWLLSLSFGSVAFAITSFGRVRIASIGIATLYALGGYIIASLIDVAEWLNWPAKLFPFDYYQPAKIMESSYNYANLMFLFVIIGLCAVVSWYGFRKRDITT